MIKIRTLSEYGMLLTVQQFGCDIKNANVFPITISLESSNGIYAWFPSSALIFVADDLLNLIVFVNLHTKLPSIKFHLALQKSYSIIIFLVVQLFFVENSSRATITIHCGICHACSIWLFVKMFSRAIFFQIRDLWNSFHCHIKN